MINFNRGIIELEFHNSYFIHYINQLLTQRTTCKLLFRLFQNRFHLDGSCATAMFNANVILCKIIRHRKRKHYSGYKITPNSLFPLQNKCYYHCLFLMQHECFMNYSMQSKCFLPSTCA